MSVSVLSTDYPMRFALTARLLAPINLMVAATEEDAVRTLGDEDPEGPLYLPAMSPRSQRRLVQACDHAHPIAVDTARCWVPSERSSVIAMMREATIAFMDTEEALALTGLARWVPAANYLREVGVPIVVVKHGEYGASLFSDECCLLVPSFPDVDPVGTGGAGDAFAGGFLGAIAKAGGDLGRGSLATAMIAGTVTASFALETPEVPRLFGVSAELLSSRFDQLVEMTVIPG